MLTLAKKPATTPIPVQLSDTEFTTFILPHLTMPKRGPKCKLGYHRVFNLILWVLYTGMQWKCLPVPHDVQGKPAIHYTTVYKVFAKWADDGSLWQAFVASVRHLAVEKQLDLSVLHGDGTNTVAKKVAKQVGLDLRGAYLNLDGGFDSAHNRKCICNAGLLPNIKENPRNRKTPKRGRKRFLKEAIHALRMRVERAFAWENKAWCRNNVLFHCGLRCSSGSSTLLREDHPFPEAFVCLRSQHGVLLSKVLPPRNRTT